MFWNVRATPRLVIWYGFISVVFTPPMTISPSVGL
jgi:hypothetical protein